MKKIGKISPFFTCSRSLADELGLKCGDDFIEGEIRCLGLLFDTLRAQPFCVFYIRSSMVSFDKLKQNWLLRAKDKHENRDVIGMDWNEDTARTLINGRLDYHDILIEIASNQAQAGFMLAAIHEFDEDINHDGEKE